MEKKNKKLIILVSILLVGIGVSLAYFVGTSMFGGVGSKVEGVASSINGATLNVEGILEFNDLDILPGHQTISSVKVTATGNNELIPYNLIWKGINTLNTPLNYTIYKTTERKEVDITCEKKTNIENGAQILYEECTIQNIEQLGSIIARGTINKEETKVTLASEEFITATSDGATVYYYIILEYPNLEEEQNEDMGGTFNGQVTVEESNAKPDINILAVKIEQEDGTYKDSTDIPQSGYIINEEKSVCSNGASPTGIVPNIAVNDLSKNGTSCYLYFDEYSANNYILANIGIENLKNKIPDFSQTAVSDEGIFKAEDNDGETYYFRGAAENNYVKFADFYWRIIRINGDGTIRLIYQGPKATSTGKTSAMLTLNNDATYKNYSVFNSNTNNNMYVGFKYTSGQVHGTNEESDILKELNKWYLENLKNYESKIAVNAGFCGDRTPSTSSSTINNSGGTGTARTYYGGYIRLVTNKQPSLKCPAEDLYTTSGSIKGNKSLNNPIGLVTVDEVSMAGGLYKTSNQSYYLCSETIYWTMSPSEYDPVMGHPARLFYVGLSGDLSTADARWTPSVRPVINLRADITFTFNGTGEKGSMTNPYVVY